MDTNLHIRKQIKKNLYS